MWQVGVLGTRLLSAALVYPCESAQLRAFRVDGLQLQRALDYLGARLCYVVIIYAHNEIDWIHHGTDARCREDPLSLLQCRPAVADTLDAPMI